MSPFRHFDGMCWPVPGPALSELDWRLRYALNQSDALVAAAVVSAFQELVRLPAKKRDAIIRELRKETR
jgi:hypothetical protein